ncbi:two-component-system connector protein YcgZ [Kosakonia sp. H02]|nr:two-component-system connector protein YcgZ [Kosakonia sp. H02]
MKEFPGKGTGESALCPQGNTPSTEETLGAIVIEMLREKRQVSRQSLCIKLASRIDNETDPLLEAHYGELLGLVFGKKTNT